MSPPVVGRPARPLRWRGRAIFAVFVLAGLAVVSIKFFPQLSHAVGQAIRLPSPRWPWILLAILAIAVSYWFSALSLQAAVGSRLPMRRTVLVQLVAAVANRLTPGSVGGAAVNVRYLTNIGFRFGTAGAAVALIGTAHVVVAIFALLLFGPAALSHSAGAVGVWISQSWPWIGLAIAILAVATLIGVRSSRPRFVRARAQLRTAMGDGLRAVRSLKTKPARVAELIGCVAAVKAANLLALYSALWAFDGDVAGWRVAVAYLVGVTTVEAIPMPGGLGTVDAALILGLAGAGSSAGAVFAAVVAYRLLAFWAPIMPGVAGSAFLRRRAVL